MVTFNPRIINKIGQLRSASLNKGSSTPRRFDSDLKNNIGTLKSADPGQSFHARSYTPNIKNNIGPLQSASNNSSLGRSFNPGGQQNPSSNRSRYTPPPGSNAGLGGLGGSGNPLGRVEKIQSLENELTSNQPGTALQALAKLKTMTLTKTDSLCYSSIYSRNEEKDLSQLDALQLLEKAMNHTDRNVRFEALKQAIDIQKISYTYDTSSITHNQCRENSIKKALSDSDSDIVQHAFNKHGLKDYELRDYVPHIFNKIDLPQQRRSEILLEIYGHTGILEGEIFDPHPQLKEELKICRLVDSIKTLFSLSQDNLKKLKAGVDFQKLDAERQKSIIWWLYGGHLQEGKFISSTRSNPKAIREASINLGATHLNTTDLKTMLLHAAGDEDESIRDAALAQVKVDEPKIGVQNARQIFKKAEQQLAKESYKFSTSLYKNCPSYAHDILEQAMKDPNLQLSALYGAMNSKIPLRLLKKVWNQTHQSIESNASYEKFETQGAMEKQIKGFIENHSTPDDFYKLAWQHADKLPGWSLTFLFFDKKITEKLQNMCDKEPDFRRTLSDGIQKRLDRWKQEQSNKKYGASFDPSSSFQADSRNIASEKKRDELRKNQLLEDLQTLNSCQFKEDLSQQFGILGRKYDIHTLCRNEESVTRILLSEYPEISNNDIKLVMAEVQDINNREKSEKAEFLQEEAAKRFDLLRAAWLEKKKANLPKRP